MTEDHEPPARKPRLDCEESAKSKTVQAFETVLGKCPDVTKLEKLRNALTKNPKSFFTLIVETHLACIQILTLKAYKQLHSDLKIWKEEFKTNAFRDANDTDMKSDPKISEQWKKYRVDSKLLEVWKIIVHLA